MHVFVYSIVLLLITAMFVVRSLPLRRVLLIFSVGIFNPYFVVFFKLCGNICIIF
jgi:hypothetical protein